MGETNITGYSYTFQNKEYVISKETLKEEYNEELFDFVSAHSADGQEPQEVIDAAYNYVVNTFLKKDGVAHDKNGKPIDNGKKDGKIQYEEWADESTYKALGLDIESERDRETMRKVFGNIDLNGDGVLDKQELIALYFYKDATNSGKNGKKIGKDFTFDGKTEMTEEDEDNPAVERNLTLLANDSSGLRTIANSIFGRVEAYDELVKNSNPETQTPQTAEQAQVATGGASFLSLTQNDGSRTSFVKEGENYKDAVLRLAEEEILAGDKPDGTGAKDGRLSKEEFIELQIEKYRNHEMEAQLEQVKQSFIEYYKNKYGTEPSEEEIQEAVDTAGEDYGYSNDALRARFGAMFDLYNLNGDSGDEFLDKYELASAYAAMDVAGDYTDGDLMNDFTEGTFGYEPDGVIEDVDKILQMGQNNPTGLTQLVQNFYNRFFTGDTKEEKQA